MVMKRVADLRIGVEVLRVDLELKSPPPQTINAFDNVLHAQQQSSAAIQKAEAYKIEQLALAQSESDRIVSEAADADLIIVNTCAVRDHAEKKALSITGGYKHLKEKNPALIIGVPVGFVNVVESKELFLDSPVPHIIARGRKGGSNVAAAICNALLYQILR